MRQILLTLHKTEERIMEAYKRELSKQEKARLAKIKESKNGKISRLGEFILSGMTYGEINDKRAVLK